METRHEKSLQPILAAMGDTQFESLDAMRGIWFVVRDGVVALDQTGATKLGCARELSIPDFAALFATDLGSRLHDILDSGGTQLVRLNQEEFRLSVSPRMPDGSTAGELHRIPRTDEREAEETRYRQRFQLLAEIVSLGVMVLDKQGKPYFANTELHRMLDLPETQTATELAVSMVHPQDVERVSQSFAEYAVSERDEWVERYRVVTDAGNVREVESRCRRERNGTGETAGFISCLIDVGRPVPATPEMVTPDGVDDPLALGKVGHWSWSPATQKVTWSESLYDIYRVPLHEEITPESAVRNIPKIQADLLSQEVSRSAAEGRGWEYEHDIIFDDGTAKRVISRGRAFGKPGEMTFAGTVIDVTEQREREQKIRQAEKLRAIGQLASGVAHDFNNMLGAIIGNATVLAEEVSPELQRPVVEIQVAAERVTRLTRQLLTFSRNQQLERAAVNIHELLDEVYTLVGHSFSARIKVERAFKANNSMVIADASQLQSAFLNLLVNARDALSGTAGTLEVVTRNITEGSREFIEIVFRDDGPGMDEETQRRAFEPFFTTRRESGGTGLGLSATYGAVLRHGGSIELESEPGNGTTFVIQLATMTSAEAEAADEEDRDRRWDGEGLTVWIVDDEPLMRSLAARVFSRAHYGVESFASGEEVLTAIRDKTPNALIVDHHMPGISGTELVKRLRDDGFEGRIVIVTGNAFELESGWSDGYDVHCVVEKPYAVAELLAAVSDE